MGSRNSAIVGNAIVRLGEAPLLAGILPIARHEECLILMYDIGQQEQSICGAPALIRRHVNLPRRQQACVIQAPREETAECSDIV